LRFNDLIFTTKGHESISEVHKAHFILPQTRHSGKQQHILQP